MICISSFVIFSSSCYGVTENSQEKGIASSSEMAESVSSTERSMTDDSKNNEPLSSSSPAQTQSKRNSPQQLSGEEWAVVSNVNELKTELANKKPLIKFADSSEIFDMKNISLPISSNVTIDGSGRTVSYDRGNISSNSGIYAANSGLTIKLQNMTFGASDFSVSAVGLYGIMQADRATTLYIENVDYYSNKSAQPFYVRDQNSSIHFLGTNHFIQQNKDGSEANGQEFAECNHLIFEAGSQTTIIQNTDQDSGFLWMPNNSGSIDVKDDAEVTITTNHNFIYSDGGTNGAITLGENAKMNVKGTNSSKGDFNNFDKAMSLLVGKSASFTMDFPNSMKLTDTSTIEFQQDATGTFISRNSENVFDRSVGANSTFVINNAKSLTFQGKSGTTYDPIGFVGGTNKFSFSAFKGDTRGYDVVLNPSTALEHLTPQLDAGAWTIGSSAISRQVFPTTPDFTSEEKTKLKNANNITLQRLNVPIELTAIEQAIDVEQASFTVKEYQLHGNEEYLKGADFKLYSKKTSAPETEGDGFLSTQQVDDLTKTSTFTNLKEQTDYWLYVRIVCDPDSQSSKWLEVPFKTKQEMINVTFPINTAFHTKKSGQRQKVQSDQNYLIENHSSFPILVKATALTELSNPDNIALLSSEASENSKDLFLTMTQDDKMVGVLTKNLAATPETFEPITGKSTSTLGYGGIYYGNAKKKVQYQLTLTAERKE